MVMDFASGAVVGSVLVPFACEGCKTELLEPMAADDALPGKLEQRRPCARCGQDMVFDDLPEHFLAFRSPS
jgi:hypothetical protein